MAQIREEWMRRMFLESFLLHFRAFVLAFGAMEVLDKTAAVGRVWDGFR